MLKLLLSLISAVAIAACVLQLRQQRLNMSYEVNKLHDCVEASHSRLWNQQLQIALYTAPNAISQTVGQHQLNMVSPKLAKPTPTATRRPH